MRNTIIFLAGCFFILVSSHIFGQVFNSGIGLPPELNPDGTLHLFGIGHNGAGARLVLGDDLGSFDGVRTYIAEFGWQNPTPIDSDILEMHGQKGLKFTVGYDKDNLKIPLEITNSGFIKVPIIDTVLSSHAFLVLQPDGAMAVAIKPKIGDIAYGGIVFWVDDRGEHGLVVDTADLTTGIPWNSNTTKITAATGGNVPNGSTGDKGAGMMNTMLIVSENREGNSAARLCSDLSRGGYGDWYLPSKGELNLLYLNRNAVNASLMGIGGGSLYDGFHWSSTEIDSTGAVCHDFYSGDQLIYSKASLFRVRAIRFF